MLWWNWSTVKGRWAGTEIIAGEKTLFGVSQGGSWVYETNTLSAELVEDSL